jgi:endonuclease-3
VASDVSVNRHEKAEKIGEILDRLYPAVDIPLAHRDPFTLLVAVVLSAQTTDKLVNQVTPALFARAGTPEEMAELPVDEIAELIHTIGLTRAKAHNVKQLSALLVAEHGGQVPQSFEALEALPGVGHKTASVVMNQAFGEPAFAVDTHIHRLAARWGLSPAKSVEQTERDLKSLFPEASWGKVHLQMIYFGREHCPALRHDFEACPICSWAASGQRKGAERRRGASLRRSVSSPPARRTRPTRSA